MSEHYTEYFLNEFASSFQQITYFGLNNTKSEKVKEILNSVLPLFEKLDYGKIATKFSVNIALQNSLIYLKNNNFAKKCFMEKVGEKSWNIIPNYNICLIFLHMKEDDADSNANKITLYGMLYELFSLSSMYVKAVENNEFERKINETKELSIGQDVIKELGMDGFNPFETIGNTDGSTIDINTMFKDAEKKSYLPHEMLIKMMEQMNGDKNNSLTSRLNEINEEELSSASSNLANTLNSEGFKEQESSKILLQMIGKVQRELLNLSNDTSKETMTNKESMAKLENIAKSIAGEMQGYIGNDLDNMKDLFDCTAQLSKSKIDNPLMDMLIGTLRNKIVGTIDNFKELEKKEKRNKKTTKLIQIDESAMPSNNSINAFNNAYNANNTNNNTHNTNNNTYNTNNKQPYPQHKLLIDDNITQLLGNLD